MSAVQRTVACRLAEGACDFGEQRRFADRGEAHEAHPGVAHCGSSGSGSSSSSNT